MGFGEWIVLVGWVFIGESFLDLLAFNFRIILGVFKKYCFGVFGCWVLGGWVLDLGLISDNWVRVFWSKI